MNCPNCQSDVNDCVICPECGVDIILYKHSLVISDRLYNQGLRYLKSGDMTHGIKNLTRCIIINKEHVAARNLLGLALFEIGYIGDAIKHWLISQKIMSENNPAIRYIEMTEKMPELEDFDEAITRYNRALEFLKDRDDTAAVTQLKAAVEFNPRFVDALNMLTLCYLIKNNIEAAMPLIERVLKIDPMNPIAKNYDSIINPSGKKKQRQPRQEAKPAPQVPIETPPPTPVKTANSHMVKVLLFVSGFATAFVFLFFLIIQPSESRHAEALDQARLEWAELESELSTNLGTAEDELNTAKSQMGDMQVRINELENLRIRQSTEINVINAFLFYSDGYLDRAIELLDDVTNDFNSLDQENHNRINTIREGAYPRLAVNHFEQGQRILGEENGNPEDALNFFKSSYRFFDGNMDAPQMQELLFLLGSLSIEFDMNLDAHHYLSTLQTNFPNYRAQEVADLLETILEPNETETEEEE